MGCNMKNFLTTCAIIMSLATPVYANKIAEVSTTFRLLGANDKIIIERFDDPSVENASCYVSYAQTGGISGVIGFAEDPSRFSIACRATGEVSIVGNVPETMTEIFNRSTSILFKEMRVSRMIDTEKNVLVYLVWSTKLIDGSPFNAITAIPIE
jgi:CreA protein